MYSKIYMSVFEMSDNMFYPKEMMHFDRPVEDVILIEYELLLRYEYIY